MTSARALTGSLHEGFAGIVRRALQSASMRGVQVQPPVVRLRDHNDAASLETIRMVAPYTMTPPPRLATLRDVVEYLVAARVPGAIVECGVWRGGSVMAAALTLLELGAGDRPLWLYDTIDGMTEPTEHDRTADGRHAQDWIAGTRARTDGPTTGDFGASQDEVAHNIETVGYPRERVRYVAGPVEQTLLHEVPDQIALIRLDIDFYESTSAALAGLYPRLAPGGVLIIDDYGYWLGARRAVDEYFRDDPVLLVRLGRSARLVIKPHHAQPGRNLD
jgi:hypothetical protein